MSARPWTIASVALLLCAVGSTAAAIEPAAAEVAPAEAKSAEPKPKSAEPKSAEPKSAEPKSAEPKPKSAEAEPKSAEPPALPRYASVEIDTSDIGEEGPVVKRRVQERTDVVLRAAKVLPARAEIDDPIIHLDIDELVGSDPGYQFSVWVTQRGKPRGERRQVECTLCTESEVVSQVEASITEILAELGAGEAHDDEVIEPPKDEPRPLTRGADEQPRVRLGGLGKAGVASLVVGGAAAAAGAVLVVLPPKVKLDDPLYETTTRPPGAVVLGVGAVAVISGVVMLVVDRKRARARAVTVAPTPEGAGAAVSWSGRF